MQRITLFLVPGVVAIVLFIAVNSYQTFTAAINKQSDLADQELYFDGYAEGVTTVFFDQSGQIEYTLKADRQVHYKDDRSELTNPFIRLFENGSADWNVVAKQGMVSPGKSNNKPLKSDNDSMSDNSFADIDSIELSGEVEVYNIDSFGNRTVLTTESVTMNPNTETLVTQLPVHVSTSNMQQTAIGMLADLKRNEMLFYRNVTGRYTQDNNIAAGN